MQVVPDLITLIDHGKSIAGSDYKLAKLIGVTPQAISNWRHGEKPCPPGDVALIAAVAGLNPQEWLARATLWKYEGTDKGDRLMKVLGKASLATIGVIASSGASAAAIFGSAALDTLQSWLVACSTMYIMYS